MRKILVVFLIMLFSAQVHAFSWDARRVAMAEAEVPGEWPGYKNPALRLVAPWQRYAIPLPSGLLSLPDLKKPETIDEVEQLSEGLFPLPFHYTLNQDRVGDIPLVVIDFHADSINCMCTSKDDWHGNGRITYAQMISTPVVAFLIKGFEFHLGIVALTELESDHHQFIPYLEGKSIKEETKLTGSFAATNSTFLTLGVGWGRKTFWEIMGAVRPKLVFGVGQIKAGGEYFVQMSEDGIYKGRPDYQLAANVLASYPFSPRMFPGLGISLDLGLARSLGRGWIAGLGLTDLGKVWWKTGFYQVDEELELETPVSSSFSQTLPCQTHLLLAGPVYKSLFLVSEVEVRQDYGSAFRTGLEYPVWRFTPRLGLRWESGEILASGGLGLRVWRSLALDVAITETGSTPLYNGATLLAISLSI